MKFHVLKERKIRCLHMCLILAVFGVCSAEGTEQDDALGNAVGEGSTIKAPNQQEETTDNAEKSEESYREEIADLTATTEKDNNQAIDHGSAQEEDSALISERGLKDQREGEASSEDVQVTKDEDRRERILRLQQDLQLLGFDPGALDGQLGPNTLNAVNAWLAGNSEVPVDDITPELGARIRQAVQDLEKLGEQEIRLVQMDLQALGYDVEAVDGVAGTKTMDALNDFLQERGRAPVGVLGRSSAAIVEDAALGILPFEQTKELQRGLWGLGVYPSRSIDGVAGEDTYGGLENLGISTSRHFGSGQVPKRPTFRTLSEVERRITRSEHSLSREQLEETQSQLNYLNFPVGPVDGTIGTQTRVAVNGFLAAKKLPEPVEAITPVIIQEIDSAYTKQIELETAAYERAIGSGDPNKLFEFARTYPDSRFSVSADNEIARLTGGSKASRTINSREVIGSEDSQAKVSFRGYTKLKVSTEAFIVRTNEDCAKNEASQKGRHYPIVSNLNRFFAAVRDDVGRSGTNFSVYVSGSPTKKFLLEGEKISNFSEWAARSKIEKYIKEESHGRAFLNNIEKKGYSLIGLNPPEKNWESVFGKLPQDNVLRESYCIDFISPIYYGEAKGSARVAYFAYSRVFSVEYNRNVELEDVVHVLGERELLSVRIQDGVAPDRGIGGAADNLLMLKAAGDPFEVLEDLDNAGLFATLRPTPL